MKSFITSASLRVLLVLTFCIAQINLFAQNQIEGIITSGSDNLPVSGAVVTIENSFSTSITDNNGHFTFKSLPGKTYEAVISHLSFDSKKVTLTAQGENKFSLSMKVYLAEEVTINSTRVDKKSGTAFNNISNEELGKNNLGQDLPFLLNNLPSVVTTSDAGTGVGYTGIRVRGNDATRVNVTINGIPVNEAESHLVYWVDLPDIASSVDNIQFQRGLGTSTNGAGAFGASLNLQTTKLSQSPYGTISSSIGSFNTNKNTVAFGTGVLNNHFTIDGRMSLINSDGFVDRATANLRSLFLSGGYYDNKQFLRAVIISGKEKTYQSWYGLPQEVIDTNRTYNYAGEYYDAAGNVKYYDNQTDNYQQDYYQLLYSRTINPSLTANIGLHYTKGGGYYEEYQPGATLNDYGIDDVMLADTIISATDLIRRKWLQTDFYGLTWSLDYSKKALEIKLGGAANNYKGRHYNEVIASGYTTLGSLPFTYFDDSAEKSDANFFLKTTYQLNKKLALTLDLQDRMIDYNFSKLLPEGSDNAKLNFFNPKIGASYQFNNKNQASVYIGNGHKEPIREDFLAATTNYHPQAENLIDYELGYSYENAKLAVTINGYYMDYQNQLILTGKINDVGEAIRENVKNSYRAGIETQINYLITKKLSLRGNFTLSSNKIKSYTEYNFDYGTNEAVSFTYANTDISYSPAVIAAGMINYSLFNKINFNLNTKYIGKQYLDNTQSEARKIDSYMVTNLRTSCEFKLKGFRSIELTLLLNNIFGEVYNSNGYTYSGFDSGRRTDYNYFFPQAKLNWLAGITIKI
jgi:iron complex outermembrane receptor protein